MNIYKKDYTRDSDNLLFSLNTIRMDIHKLSFWDKNPRKITAENLEKLQKSIVDDSDFLEKRKILVNDVD